MASYSSTNQTLTIRGVNVNSVGDTPFCVPFSKFQLEIMKVTNASVDLSSTLATLGLYTAPAAGGTALVTPATGVLTPLSAATKVNSATVASTDAATGTVVSPQARLLYLRCGVAHGSAATVDVIVKLLRIP